MNVRQEQRVAFAVLFGCTLLVVLPVLIVLAIIFVRGVSALDLDFLLGMPEQGMNAGGIFPAILGTLYLVLGAVAFAVPLGVLSAIYLVEYSRDNAISRLIKLAIVNLAGVPSVVYGLFGLGIFVVFFGFGVSILSGSLTLGIMILPVIITASREALESVPRSFRMVSLSLGRKPLADHPPYRAPACAAGHPDRNDSRTRPGCRRDRPDSLYRCRVLSPEIAGLGVRPDHGAAIPPVCHFDPGAGYPRRSAVWHGARPPHPGSVAEPGGHYPPVPVPEKEEVVTRCRHTSPYTS